MDLAGSDQKLVKNCMIRSDLEIMDFDQDWFATDPIHPTTGKIVCIHPLDNFRSQQLTEY